MTDPVDERDAAEDASQQAYDELLELHAEVDRLTGSLTTVHGPRLHCGLGCTHCCVDDITVFAVEAERIRRNAPDVLGQAPHPAGACAFLDDTGACRVYAHRPYVCRTQGLPLRWLDEGPDGDLAEYRDICPVNEPDIDLVALAEAHCWTLGPVESVLRELAEAFDGEGARVPLRALFGQG